MKIQNPKNLDERRREFFEWLRIKHWSQEQFDAKAIEIGLGILGSTALRSEAEKRGKEVLGTVKHDIDGVISSLVSGPFEAYKKQQAAWDPVCEEIDPVLREKVYRNSVDRFVRFFGTRDPESSTKKNVTDLIKASHSYRSILSEWSTKWNLSDDWIQQVVEFSLIDWHESAPEKHDYRWFFPSLWGKCGDDLIIRLPSYAPELHGTVTDYRDRLNKLVSQELDPHIEDLREEYGEKGKRTRNSQPQHFLALILKDVLGQRRKDVAELLKTPTCSREIPLERSEEEALERKQGAALERLRKRLGYTSRRERERE